MAAPRTLRRYIAGKFLTGIFGTFLLLSLLIFMIDFVELLRQSGNNKGISALSLAVIGLYRLPAYTEFLLAFAVLSGSIFALLMLNRKSELAVMRAGGMSVWQFLRPGIMSALILGVCSFSGLQSVGGGGTRGSGTPLRRSVRSGNQPARHRQRLVAAPGWGGRPIRHHALAASNRGLTLTGVTVFMFDPAGNFSERIDAATADLKEGYWHIKDAWVARPGREPEKFASYLLSTYLTPERVQRRTGLRDRGVVLGTAGSHRSR